MSQPPFTRDDVRAKIRGVVATFVVTTVVAFVVAAGLFSVVDDAMPTAWPLLAAAYAVSAGMLASSLACVVVLSRLTKQARARFDSGYPWGNGISSRLTKGEGIADDQRPLAAQYAAALSVHLPLQLAQMVFLYLGLLGVQLASIAGAETEDFLAVRIGLAVLVTIAVAVSVPYSLVQIGRVRRYAAENAELPRR